jgi:hypothetical protein
MDDPFTEKQEEMGAHWSSARSARVMLVSDGGSYVKSTGAGAGAMS